MLCPELVDKIMKIRSHLCFKERIKKMEKVLLQHRPREFIFELGDGYGDGIYVYQVEFPMYHLEWTIAPRWRNESPDMHPGYYTFEFSKKPLVDFEEIVWYREIF